MNSVQADIIIFFAVLYCVAFVAIMGVDYVKEKWNERNRRT